MGVHAYELVEPSDHSGLRLKIAKAIENGGTLKLTAKKYIGGEVYGDNEEFELESLDVQSSPETLMCAGQDCDTQAWVQLHATSKTILVSVTRLAPS